MGYCTAPCRIAVVLCNSKVLAWNLKCQQAQWLKKLPGNQFLITWEHWRSLGTREPATQPSTNVLFTFYPYISFHYKHTIYASPGSLVYHTTGKPFKAFDFFVCFSIHLGTSKQQTQDPVLSFLATQIPPSRTSSRTCRKLSTALSTSW